MLVPTSGVLATVTKVARTNPDAAAELVRFGLFEALSDQVDECRPLLELDAVAIIEDSVAKARSSMLRSHVGKALSGAPEPDDLVYAEHLAALEEFAKASLSGALLSLFNRKHPRDKGSGQFVSASTSQGVDPDHEVQTRHAAHQTNAKRIVAGWRSEGLAGENDELTLHYQKIDVMDGKPVEQAPTQLPSNVASLDDDLERYNKTERGQRLLVGISLNRGSVKAKTKNQGAMDALSMLTNDQKSLGLGARFLNKVPASGDWNGAAQDWNTSSSQGDRQSYRRLKLTGQALNSVSQQGSPAAMIGGLAQLVGDLGPEAEKVLGPGFTRAAYRYRGTERRPDKELAESVEYANQSAAASFHPDTTRREGNIGRIGRASVSNKDSIPHRIADYYTGQTGTRDEIELASSGDVATALLARNLPNLKVAQLSLASREVPPSEGVIIDADGHLVSQAIGFKGDHYLPFDLKNLKRLNGGQYVRTRLSGGPTTEDVYTGLMTGARQIQVVSHSGVFTMQFDPDLRGGRRYTDKARKMVSRYESLLGVLAGGNEVREDIDPAVVARVRRQAYGDANWDPETGEKNFAAELARLQTQGSVGLDEEEIEQATMARAKAKPEWARASRVQRGEIEQESAREVRDELGSAAYRMYRLDGPGYHGALQALQQEFPYFIRKVKWEPLPDFNMDRGLPRGDSPRFGPKDRGHVGPDQLHAFDRGRGRLVPTAEGASEAGAAGGRSDTPRANPASPGANAANPAVKLTDILAPETKFSRKLAIAFNQAFGHLGNAPVGGDVGHEWIIEDARGQDPLPFAKWIWRKNGADPDKMADWLLKEATPDDKAAIATAAIEFAEVAPDIKGIPIRPETVERGAHAVEEYIGLLDPYETTLPEGDRVAMSPKTKNPRPLPFDDIIVLSDSAKLDAFVSAAAHQDKPLASFIQEFADDPGKARVVVDELVEAHKKDPSVRKTLEAAQRAWSFVKTAEVVDQIEVLELGGGVAPKAPAPSPGESGEAKKSSRGSLRPLRPQQSPATKALIEKFLGGLQQ